MHKIFYLQSTFGIYHKFFTGILQLLMQIMKRFAYTVLLPSQVVMIQSLQPKGREFESTYVLFFSFFFCFVFLPLFDSVGQCKTFYYLISTKTYGKYRMSTEGKNILCANREVMHLCQANKIKQKHITSIQRRTYVDETSVIIRRIGVDMLCVYWLHILG